MKEVLLPFLLRQRLKTWKQSGFKSEAQQHISHAGSDWERLPIQTKAVLNVKLFEGASGGGGKIVRIERESERVVNGEYLILVILAPVLDQRDVRCRPVADLSSQVFPLIPFILHNILIPTPPAPLSETLKSVKN
jgi:hypothetical protein